MTLNQLITYLTDWNMIFAYMAVGFIAAAVEYVYGLFLSHSPVAEARARGYARMHEAVAGFVTVTLFFMAVNAVAAAISQPNIPPPSAAVSMLERARDRFVKWLIEVANLEKDLTAAVITAPLVQTVAAAAMLGRIALQSMLALVAAFSFALPLMTGGLGQLMLAAGAACMATPRLRHLGPYLIFSAIAILVSGCGVASAANDLAEQLKFKYEGFGSLPNPIEFFRIIYELLTGRLIPALVNDGYNAARTLIWVSIGIAAAAVVAAAASGAAGGFADSLVNRIRL